MYLCGLEKQNINFCFTAYDIKDKKLFLPNVRKAIKNGLSEKMALKALTSNPANFIGVQDKIGSLKKGMLANFFISSESIFEDNAIIYETWSNGIKHLYHDLSIPNINRTYQLTYGSNTNKLTINKEQENYSGLVQLKDSLKAKANVAFKNNLLTLSFPYDSTFTIRFSGIYDDVTKSFSGKGQYADGTWVDFKLTNLNIIDTAKSSAPKKEIINYSTNNCTEVVQIETLSNKNKKKININFYLFGFSK